MNDLYKHLGITADSSKEDILRAVAGSSDKLLVEDANFVLLDDKRRKIYDRNHRILKLIGRIRADLDLCYSPSWILGGYADFNPGSSNRSTLNPAGKELWSQGHLRYFVILFGLVVILLNSGGIYRGIASYRCPICSATIIQTRAVRVANDTSNTHIGDFVPLISVTYRVEKKQYNSTITFDTFSSSGQNLANAIVKMNFPIGSNLTLRYSPKQPWNVFIEPEIDGNTKTWIWVGLVSIGIGYLLRWSKKEKKWQFTINGKLGGILLIVIGTVPIYGDFVLGEMSILLIIIFYVAGTVIFVYNR